MRRTRRSSWPWSSCRRGSDLSAHAGLSNVAESATSARPPAEIGRFSSPNPGIIPAPYRSPINLLRRRPRRRYGVEAGVRTVEERVAYLDGTVEGHAEMIGEVRESVASLEGRIERRFDRVEHRLELMDAKATRQFHWLVGILVMVVLANFGVLGTVLSSALSR
jgi:hypothetical protein